MTAIPYFLAKQEPSKHFKGLKGGRHSQRADVILHSASETEDRGVSLTN